MTRMADEKRVWTVDDLPESETVEQHGKDHPVVGAKLRLLRERHGDKACLITHHEETNEDMVRYTAMLSLGVHTDERRTVSKGTGTAHQGQERVGDNNLHELAETRAIARCLRFAGYAVDAADASEVQGQQRPDGSAHDDANPTPATDAGTDYKLQVVADDLTTDDEQLLRSSGLEKKPGVGWVIMIPNTLEQHVYEMKESLLEDLEADAKIRYKEVE